MIFNIANCYSIFTGLLLALRENLANFVDKASVNQIVKNAIKGKTAKEWGDSAGQPHFENNSKFTIKQLTNGKIDENK